MTKTLTRAELYLDIQKSLENLKEKFTSKNGSYGGTEDGFHNFKASAIRFYGSDSLKNQFMVAMVLLDKHMVTLAKNGISDKECIDRLEDLMAYGAIMIAMRRLWDDLQKVIDLTNMTVEEAKDALRKGLCERVYCKEWSSECDEEWIRYEASTNTFMYCKVIEGRYSEELVRRAMNTELGWSKGTLKDEK